MGVDGAISSSYSRLNTRFAPGSQKLGQANKIIGGDAEDEDGADLGQPAQFHLREAARRLAPAKALLDAFTQPLADRIAEAVSTSSGTAVLRVTPFLLTVPLIATCGSIPRAFSPSTKASAS